MGIYDVDTRAITCRLRQDGSLIGVLSTDNSITDEELLKMSRSWDIVGIDLISGLSCQTVHEWVDKTKQEWDFSSGGSGETFHVVAYDFGIKHNILKHLASYGCKITVVPSTWPATETLKMNPDGVLFSNGPGDPSTVPYAVETVKKILGKVPIFGICMGHQLLGQALGGKTFKMKFGHHGGNHPVRNLRTGHVEISAQNHNYAVDPTTLPEGVEVIHVNLNDGGCAGLAFPAQRIMSLQYHPEASLGPHDSDYAFGEFIELMKQQKTKKLEKKISTWNQNGFHVPFQRLLHGFQNLFLIMSNRLSSRRSWQKKQCYKINLETQSKSLEDQISGLKPELGCYQNHKQLLEQEQLKLRQRVEIIQKKIMLKNAEIEMNKSEVNKLRECSVMQQGLLQAPFLSWNIDPLQHWYNDPNSYQGNGVGTSYIPAEPSHMWIHDNVPNMHGMNMNMPNNYIGSMINDISRTFPNEDLN
ncbi:carbamoyl-phosphate synthase small chain, chloroplastic-like [Vigna unguiculata]|uniref:carbamoyl-phosphate synthase small chain, chloroplastic-like n=1 Tax=Vigna unguiculata TaxID=3917 RepID=UPI001016B193|nr:carbamoyl-phosphate synthase small chain, chloroplastic-like [Vigna unguiculata]